jgi:hypothetical protein
VAGRYTPGGFKVFVQDLINPESKIVDTGDHNGEAT